jgi:hypothetical protein
VPATAFSTVQNHFFSKILRFSEAINFMIGGVWGEVEVKCLKNIKACIPLSCNTINDNQGSQNQVYYIGNTN